MAMKKKLYDIHLGILAGDNGVVKGGLAYFNEIENKIYENDKIVYCAYSISRHCGQRKMK